MTTPFNTLERLRRDYPTPMSTEEIGQLLNAVAWAHRADGFGLLRKPTGANCRQPQTGTLISRDILMLPDGRIWDCLIDAEGRGMPTWNPKQALDHARFVAAVDASVALPPPVIVPPVAKPDFPQRYPDEATWWTTTLGEIGGLYEQKGEGFNLGMFKWSARIAYDIGAGMEKERSKAKHLAELRQALGL
jgi:hypothetical protein